MNEYPSPESLSLVDKNSANLSIYSHEEELQQMKQHTERVGIDCVLIPIKDGSTILGYGVFPADLQQQAEIVAEAPWVLSDYDDTAATTTLDKRRCWTQLQSLGLSEELVRSADRVSRINFGQGEIYEPELDKRILTAVMQNNTEPTEVAMREKVNQWLQNGQTATQLWADIPVDEQIEQIFLQTRHKVDLYPDTSEVFKALRGASEKRPEANVFILTYGDCPFQLGKTLSLLKDRQVQGIFVVKSKKGHFLEQLFRQGSDIFQQLSISYSYPETPRRGIDVQQISNPIIVFDDDAKQVDSINGVAENMGIPMLAVGRHRSPDHKRFELDTPEGEHIIELNRGEDLQLTRSVAEVRDTIFALAIEKSIIWNFENWLSVMLKRRIQFILAGKQDVYKLYLEKPRVAVIDFISEQLEVIDSPLWESLQAVAIYRYGAVSESTLVATKEDLIKKCQIVLQEKLAETV